jgi:hypothetical protein
MRADGRPSSEEPTSGESARAPLPLWSIPLLAAVGGIILFVGNLSPLLCAVVAAETLVVCLYLFLRARWTRVSPRPISNVLSLFPGHLLLLLVIALLDAPNGLAAVWAAVPAVSIAYDLVSRHAPRGRGRTSMLIGLYAILWAALFALLERVVVLHRALEWGEEVIVAAAFGLFGILFLSLGIYRHWRGGKE